MPYKHKTRISKISAVLIFTCFLFSCSKPKEPLIEAGHDKKIAEYKEAIKANPDDIQPHYNLGTAYAIAGKQKEAQEEYTTLKTQDEKLATELLNIINKISKLRRDIK